MPLASRLFERLRRELAKPIQLPEVPEDDGPRAAARRHLLKSYLDSKPAPPSPSEALARRLARLEGHIARIYEHSMLMLCTKPPERLQPEIYSFARDVVSDLTKSFNRLDPELVDEVAFEVMKSFAKRRLPVVRYVPKAETIEGAGGAVRAYLARAIKRRAMEPLRAVLAPLQSDAAVSTERRWRHDPKLAQVDLRDTEEVRRIMGERQKHVPEGLFSMAGAARELLRSRSVVQKAILAAESKHKFKADRADDGAYWLTASQLEQVRDCLPVARAPRRFAKKKARSA